MTRRGFLGALVGLVAVKRVAASTGATSWFPGSSFAADFPPDNWIDLPEPILGLEIINGKLYAVTSEATYRIDFTAGPYRTDRRRFWARWMDHERVRVVCVERSHPYWRKAAIDASERKRAWREITVRSSRS